MSIAASILLSAALSLCCGAQTPALRGELKTLSNSRDRDRLEAAATAVASSKDPQALARLGGLLSSREFLERLDDLRKPQEQLVHLGKVMLALQANPSPASEDVCVSLAGNPNFTAIPARLNYLLPALAMVKPMSARAADVFRRTNPDGFFSVNAPLLVANGSPRALEVFESMAADGSVDAASRIDVIRRSVIPFRISAAVLRSIERLLDREVEAPVQIALLESVFEYKPALWFGRVVSPPAPPPWEGASAEARKGAIAVGGKGLRRTDLPASLRVAIGETIQLLSVTGGK
jgi:hypothetical protein